jgi:hypothetical protein
VTVGVGLVTGGSVAVASAVEAGSGARVSAAGEGMVVGVGVGPPNTMHAIDERRRMPKTADRVAWLRCMTPSLAPGQPTRS